MSSYSFYDVIKNNAQLHGDKVAFSYEEQDLTHRQFLDQVDRLADGLVREGVERADRIGVLSQNRIEYLCIYGAAAKVGAAVVPINWRMKAGEVTTILHDSTPKVIFAETQFLPSLQPSAGIRMNVFLINPEEEGADSISALMVGEAGKVEESVATINDDYVILYTAAVDGKPRGSVLTQSNIVFASLQLVSELHLIEDDVLLSMLPLFHVHAITMAFAQTISAGRNIILAKADFDTVVDLIEEEGVTILGSFPPILNTILEKAEQKRRSINSLRCVVGLESEETVRRFEESSGGTFWTGFGQSETSGFVTISPSLLRPGSAGRATALCRVAIVDEEGKFLPPGERGEIVARGPLIFRGYFNHGAGLSEGRAPAGWHRTGDWGALDQDGYLRYLGRKPEKELIKPGGENVYPAEVEAVILEHPEVKATAVIGVEDAQWGEAIMAICVLTPSADLDEESLREFVASRLARFKKPKHVLFVGAIPMTKGGSPDREKIKQLYGGGYGS